MTSKNFFFWNKTVSMLIIYTRCIPRLIDILLHFFAQYSSLFSIDNFTQFSYTEIGGFYWGFQVTYIKNWRKKSTNPRSMLFLLTKKITTNWIVQKICNGDDFLNIFLPILPIIGMLYDNHIMLSELFHNFSLL